MACLRGSSTGLLIQSWFSNTSKNQNYGGLVKYGLGWGLAIHISDKFPGDAETAGPRVHLDNHQCGA